MAELDVNAISPLGQEFPLQVTTLNDGTELIELTPTIPGNYIVNINYGEKKNTNFYSLKFI